MVKTTKNEVLKYTLKTDEFRDFVETTGVIDCAAVKYNGRVFIFDTEGNVYSKSKGYKKCSPCIQHRHDPKYNYYSWYTTTVHRLMGLAFGLIDDINDDRDIDHRNGNKLDNRLMNLQAVTHKKNCERRSCRMYKITKNGHTYGPFIGQTNLAKFIGCDQSSIAIALSSKYNYFSNQTVKGYRIEDCTDEYK